LASGDFDPDVAAFFNDSVMFARHDLQQAMGGAFEDVAAFFA